MRNIEQESEQEYNDSQDYAAEDAYDRWREEWAEMLRDDVEALYKKFVQGKKGYYSGCPERFKEHIDTMLEYELK